MADRLADDSDDDREKAEIAAERKVELTGHWGKLTSPDHNKIYVSCILDLP